MAKIFSLLILSLILIGFLFISIIVAGIIHFSKDLPDYNQLAEYKPPIVSRLHTGDGSFLAEFSSQNRAFVPYASIPKRVVDAFIAAEDKNFFNHKGIDIRGIVRASLTNLKNLFTDKRLVGASTITQQVAKNFLLTNEVSIARKIKEALLALRIERILSKDRILELYLNEIFLGLRSYGIAAAALNYFDKSLNELSIAEVAYLAGLPKGPNNYHPIRNKRSAIIRRNYVLKRMKEEKMISSEEEIRASMQPIIIKSRKEKDLIYAPYFIEEVRRKVIEKYGDLSLYEGGLSVITTIDPILQDNAIRALRNGLENYDKRHGWRGPLNNFSKFLINDNALEERLKEYRNIAGLHKKKVAVVKKLENKEAEIIFGSEKKLGYISTEDDSWNTKWIYNSNKNFKSNDIKTFLKKGDVLVVSKSSKFKNRKQYYKIDQIPEVNGAIVVLDPRNGRVLALSGGYDFDGSEFNRATQAKRQPGSAFKPFVYLAALENGYTPSSRVLDAPLVIDQGPGLEKWKPKNYSGIFYGPSTLRTGLEKSRNVMTVRLANNVGMKKISEISTRFNMGKFPPLLATSLGSEETTLLNLVSAYAVFANGGRYNSPALIEKIQDRTGKTIFKRDNRKCLSCSNSNKSNLVLPQLRAEGKQIIDPGHAFQITWMLKGVVQRGTARRLNYIKHSIAGKTGTTNDNMDAWFLGFSPELVVGVFVGFDQPKSLGEKETGAKVAAPIFGKFMDQALKNKNTKPFMVPKNIEMIKVEPLTGNKSEVNDSKSIYEAFILGTGPEYDNSDNNYDNVIGGFEDELY